MAYLKVLFVEMPAGCPFGLADDIGGCPSVGLVDGDYDSFRVVLDAP